MAQHLQHRGPDTGSHFSDESISLAFQRLSIVGGANGQQPLISEDGALVAIVNGEIYNHRELRRELCAHVFKGTSDAEVLLHLFEDKGAQAFADLRGMFSCAIWDRRRGVLTLARDRFGIKPLFYHYDGESLFFASELKALLMCPRCPAKFDWESALAEPWFSEDLVFSARPAGSFFCGIESVQPGGYVQASARGTSLSFGRYWAIPEPRSAEETEEEAWIEHYREILSSACDEAFESSSEPALMLSGGIDSASIAAIGRGRGHSFDSFTVLTQSTALNGDAVGARDVARAVGVKNYQVRIDASDPLINPQLWLALLHLTENPSCGPEQLFKYMLLRSAKAARPSLRVMLSGQGSDECNGGYTRLLASIFDDSWEGALLGLESIAENTRHRAAGGAFAPWEQFPGLIRELSPRDHGPMPLDAWQFYQLSKLHDLEVFNLWHEDRLTSHFGIEGRTPFLDHRLVELCLGVPPSLRPRLFWDKRILRAAMGTLLPSAVTSREKVPFFYGPGLRYTERMMANLLRMDSHALLERAFPIGSSGRDFVNLESLNSLMAGIDSDPASSFALIRLVNMGNLDQSSRLREWGRPPSMDFARDCLIASEKSEPDAFTLGSFSNSSLDKNLHTETESEITTFV
jgi:asparagine synthase (glutamine-hydrolysing)